MLQTSTGGLLPPLPSIAERAVPVASKGRFTGHLVAGDGPGRIIRTESHLEMQTALIWLARPETAEIEEQVSFPWCDRDGSRRTHFFDFRIVRRDGTRVALAVKPEKRLKSGRFLAEIRRIAGQVTPDFADEVRLFTDRHIDRIELHNAELFHAVRQPDPEADDAASDVTAGLVGAVPLDELSRRIGLGPRGFRALVRLMANHRLRLVREGRITPTSEVQKVGPCQ